MRFSGVGSFSKAFTIKLMENMSSKYFLNIYFFKKLFYYSFIHMCIHFFGSFIPSAPLPHLLPASPLVPGRSCSAFITNFVEEKTQA
jgi:hypothetical protein